MSTPHINSEELPSHNTAQGTEEVRIAVNGKAMMGKQGQSIAGVLLDNGVPVLNRSIKYHRPRSYTCGFGACGNCLITVNGLPGTVSCQTPAQTGDVVELMQGLPTTQFDVLQAADLAKPLLPAGFQFKLFPKSPRLSALAGSIMGVMAGGGRMPTDTAAKHARVTRTVSLQPDVFVAGGGIAGLSAALMLADLGASVIVADANFKGGRSVVRTEEIYAHGNPIHNVAAVYERLLLQAQQSERIRLLEGDIIGMLDGVAPVVCSNTRYDVAPARTVIATGSYEVPLLFSGNDRPGIMLADAAIKLVEVEGVRFGKRAVIATDSDRGHHVAHRLHSNGVSVVAVVDSRKPDTVAAPEGDLPTGPWAQLWNHSLKSTQGLRALRRVTLSGPDQVHKILADTLIIAGRRRPTDELPLQIAYQNAGSHDHVLDDSIETPALTVGSATGDFNYDLGQIRTDVEHWYTSSH